MGVQYLAILQVEACKALPDAGHDGRKDLDIKNFCVMSYDSRRGYCLYSGS